jgi:hypothetical protein
MATTLLIFAGKSWPPRWSPPAGAWPGELRAAIDREAIGNAVLTS